MIRNPDGTPYTLANSIRTYDPCNTSEKDLFNLYDAEIIEINGTPIEYYEVFIDTNNIDPLYLEARSKLWSQTPKLFYGFYDPITSQQALGLYGIDSPDEIVIECNYQAVLQALGHKPKVGARIVTVHKREHWEIKQTNVADWKLWGEIRLQLLCDRFQENLTTGEGRVTQENKPSSIN